MEDLSEIFTVSEYNLPICEHDNESSENEVASKRLLAFLQRILLC
jgi:hypothetical protein